MDNEPELGPYEAKPVEAWFCLNRHRQHGMNGPQPIALSEIKTFFDMYSIAGDLADWYIEVIHACEEAFFEWQGNKRKQDESKNKKPSNAR